jgi:hypothetical protein
MPPGGTQPHATARVRAQRLRPLGLFQRKPNHEEPRQNSEHITDAAPPSQNKKNEKTNLV